LVLTKKYENVSTKVGVVVNDVLLIAGLASEQLYLKLLTGIVSELLTKLPPTLVYKLALNPIALTVTLVALVYVCSVPSAFKLPKLMVVGVSETDTHIDMG